MVELLGHRQPKGPATDEARPKPPRHISTLLGSPTWARTRDLRINSRWFGSSCRPRQCSLSGVRTSNTFESFSSISTGLEPRTTTGYWKRFRPRLPGCSAVLFRRSRHGRRATSRTTAASSSAARTPSRTSSASGSSAAPTSAKKASRGVDRNYPSLWRKKAAEEGRERKPRPERKGGSNATASRREAGAAWTHIAAALRSSSDAADRTCGSGDRAVDGKGGRLPANSRSRLRSEA